MDMVTQGEPARTMRRGWMDVVWHTVTFGVGPKARQYSARNLPEPVHDYLTLLGLKTALLAQPDIDTAYTALRNGEIPTLRSPAPPRRSKWREALAVTLAHAAAAAMAPKGTKKAALEAMAAERLPAMQAHAGALPAVTVRQLAQREDVSDCYRRLFGRDDGQMSLLAIAGVVDPPLPMPDDPPNDLGENDA